MPRKRNNRLDRQVGTLLRQTRIVRGHTLQQTAELLDITYQQVQKYEKGDNRITVTRLIDFAEAYGVDLHSLMPHRRIIDQPVLSPAELRAARIAHTIKDERVLAKWIEIGQCLAP